MVGVLEGLRLLTAADLRAFDWVVGEKGLRLAHPAEMVVGLQKGHRMLAQEFTAEVTLAVAELASGDRAALSHGSGGGYGEVSRSFPPRYA